MTDPAVVATVAEEWMRDGRLHVPPDDLGGDDELAFWGECEKRSLQEAEFVERLHPRNRLGRWIEKFGLDVLEVGGVVRDDLLGKNPKDVDYVAFGTPQQIKRAVEATGAHAQELKVRDRVVGIRATGPELPDGGVEIAPPRIERSTGPGRKDFEIVPHPDASNPEVIHEDAVRRDFTVNALYRDPRTAQVVDPTGRGRDDLEKKLLRTTHADSFRDDPLRILRGARFAAQHGFDVEPETMEQMRQHASSITALTQKGVSGTVMEELNKLLMSDQPSRGLRVLRDSGALPYLLPELREMIGFNQESRYHNFTVDEHTFRVVDGVAEQGGSLEVRLAALFHDSGKPVMAWRGEDGRLHYYANPDLGKPDHAEVGAQKVRTALRRLNYPRETVRRVGTLVEEHMVKDANKPKPTKARRLRARLDDDLLRDLFIHRRADIRSKGEDDDYNTSGVDTLEQMVTANSDAPRTLKDLKIDGGDLLEMGFPPGPEMGKTLSALLREVIDQPKLNNRDWLRRAAQKRLRKLPPGPQSAGHEDSFPGGLPPEPRSPAVVERVPAPEVDEIVGEVMGALDVWGADFVGYSGRPVPPVVKQEGQEFVLHGGDDPEAWREFIRTHGIGRARLKEAQDQNRENPVFATIEAKWGPDAAVARTDLEHRASPDAARIGPVTFVTMGGLLKHAHAEHRPPYAGQNGSPETGGLSALLRHEYAHSLWDRLPFPAQRRFVSALPKTDRGALDWQAIQTGLTNYAANNTNADRARLSGDDVRVQNMLAADEIWTEMFAVATDTRYNENNFPEWVREVKGTMMELLAEGPPQDSLPPEPRSESLRPSREHRTQSFKDALLAMQPGEVLRGELPGVVVTRRDPEDVEPEGQSGTISLIAQPKPGGWTWHGASQFGMPVVYDPDDVDQLARSMTYQDAAPDERGTLRDPAVMVDLFNGFDYRGVRAQLKRVKVSEEDFVGDRIHIFGTFFSPDQEDPARQVSPVGEFERTFTPNGEGGWNAYHDWVQSFYPEEGIGQAFEKWTRDTYPSQGINRIRFKAAKSGAYVWAKAGYEFATRTGSDKEKRGAALSLFQKKADDLIDALNGRDEMLTDPHVAELPDWVIAKFMSRFAGVPDEPRNMEELDDYMEHHYESEVVRGEKPDTFTSPQEIALYGLDNPWTDDQGRTMWLGKWFLLNNDWEAQLDL